jgi:hypothetical protein
MPMVTQAEKGKKRRHARCFVHAGRPVTQLVSAGKGIQLKNFYGRELTLTLNQNIPQYGCEKMKICSIIENSSITKRNASGCVINFSEASYLL